MIEIGTGIETGIEIEIERDTETRGIPDVPGVLVVPVTRTVLTGLTGKVTKHVSLYNLFLV